MILRRPCFARVCLTKEAVAPSEWSVLSWGCLADAHLVCHKWARWRADVVPRRPQHHADRQPA